MSETNKTLPEKNTAVGIKRKTSLVSLVWLIPLFALLAGAWLLFSAVRNSGPVIILTASGAEGIQAGTTVIKTLNVDVGRIVAIELNDKRDGVIMHAQMNAAAAKNLHADTAFWVVKPRIDQSGVTGLGTLVSGAYIEMLPGTQGEAPQTFAVSDVPPAGSLRQEGLQLQISGKTGRLLTVGSPVIYRNITVGTIERAAFNPLTDTTDYQIFITRPNDVLIGTDTFFWVSNGMNVDFGVRGLRIDTPPVNTLLSGAIAFDNPPAGRGSAAVAADTQFALYADRASVPDSAGGGAVYLVAFFRDSVRPLLPGAPVEYKGIRIGTVAQVPYFQNGDLAKIFDMRTVPVLLYIDPEFFRQPENAFDTAAWRQSLQNALEKGLSATLASSSLITGAGHIELADNAKNGFRPRTTYGQYSVIPTFNGGLDKTQEELNALLEKINALPLEKTLKELNASLAGMNRLLNSQSTRQIPQELNDTLAALRETLAGISPDAPAYRDLQNTLQQLDKTLRDAQPLVNTLKEQPNALIFNNSRRDPVPQGKRP